MLVWRGFGIIVPIVFVLTGLLVSWLSGDKDATLGNANFIGWTSLWSGIVLTLIGLPLLSGTEEKDDQGNVYKKKHDFFWIPVIVWGVVLGGLSAYLLIFASKSDADNSTTTTTTPSTESTEAPAPAPSKRLVHFYNPTKDSLTYIVADENAGGLIDRKKVGPMSYKTIELEKGTYTFAAFDQKKASTLTLPAKEDAEDTDKYTKYKDEKGEFYQRILGGATKENDDYDEAWLVLDGKTDLLLVNVSTACDPAVTEADVKQADWAGSIQEEYDSRDLIEPLYKQFLKDEFIKVVGPGDKLPQDIADNEVYYLLVPYKGEKDKNAVLTAAVLKARF
jgi:hypothetical protein